MLFPASDAIIVESDGKKAIFKKYAKTGTGTPA